jgi:hypothetical protein
MLGGRYRGGAGSREDAFHCRDVAARDLERIEERSSGYDRGSVLVVVEDRDAKSLAQLLFYIEAIRGANVLEIDSPDAWLEQLAEPYDIVGVFGSDFEVEDVEVGKLFEKIPFALHYGLSSERPDVAEAEDGGAVGHDGDEVSAGGVLVCILGILLDLEAGLGNAR